MPGHICVDKISPFGQIQLMRNEFSKALSALLTRSTLPFSNPMFSNPSDLSVYNDPPRSEGSDLIHKPEASA